MVTTKCRVTTKSHFSYYDTIFLKIFAIFLAFRQKILYLCTAKSIARETKMEQKYDFKQIPSGWRYCFHAQCPMKDQCLRYQTAQALPESYEMGEAVFPGALKNGRCRFFRKDEKVVMATGFLIAGNSQMSERFRAMRHSLTHYLGGNGTYYLYRNGKKWLTPQQQADIRALFRRAGYKEEVVFGETRIDYDFT